MSSPFDPVDQHVQQSPDGHYFYVREKKAGPQLPSFKSIFRQAYHDIIHGHPSYWKKWKEQAKEKRRHAKAQKAARAITAGDQNFSHVSTSSSAPFNIPPNSAFSQFSPHPILNTAAASDLALPQNINPPPSAAPSMMANSQPDNGNANNQTRGILKSDPQRFQSGNPHLPPWQGVPPQQPMPTAPTTQGFYPPHPGYPPQMGYAPQHGYSHQTGYLPQTGYMTPNPFQTTATSQYPYVAPMPPGPTQPPGGWPLQNLPAGARALSPPRYPTADELKYKCAICGRFRSASYHYKHPLSSGQIPPKTVCRRCRDASTDSEDDSDGASRRHRPRSRRRSPSVRSARRIESVGLYLGRASSRRGRGSSREYPLGDTYYDEENRRTRSISRSNSIESAIRPSSRASSRGTTRSVIRHVVEEPVQEELVVVRRPRRVRKVVYVDEQDEDYDDSQSTSRGSGKPRQSSHRYARAPTPAPRQGVRRQRSDPGLASPDYREQASYFEVSVPRRSYSRRRDPSWRGDSYQSYGSGYEDDWYANAPARLSGRSGDRYHGYDRDSERSAAPESYVARGQEETTALGERHHIGVPLPTRHMERPRSRSRSVRPPPVPEPPRQEYDSASTSDDYVTSDKDGMRIRVREI